MEKFWLVYNPDHHTPPRCRHQTEASALVEAERLARVYSGSQFFVLEAISVSAEKRVETIRLKANDGLDDELPF